MKRLATLIILLLTMLTGTAFATVTPAFVTSAKAAFLQSIADSILRIALFVQSSATLSASTTAYTGTVGVTPMTGEVSPFATYSSGGRRLTGCTVSQAAAPEVRLTCSNPVWLNSTILSDAAMIYNETTLATYGVFTFTQAESSGGSFTVTLPTNLFYLQ